MIPLEPFIRDYQLGSPSFSKVNKDASRIGSIRILGIRLCYIPIKIPVFFQDPLNHCSFIWIVHGVYPFSLDIQARSENLRNTLKHAVKASGGGHEKRMELAAAVSRLHFGFPACFSRSSCTDRRANNMPALKARLFFALRRLGCQENPTLSKRSVRILKTKGRGRRSLNRVIKLPPELEVG